MSTPPPDLQPGYPQPDQAPVTQGQLRWYLEGMKHARLAAVFGVLGIVSLGVVFGPLAIMQSKKAEAYGVPAQDGKVLGWVGIGLFIAGCLFFIAYFIFIVSIISQLPHIMRTPLPSRY
ncbi:hypothetical protein [Arthrobacter sp. R-11]|uniref:hypothetical protein n=1 Tax=Arthrobacter sp. R-11 TaxID=3404053 RepID=UPI003CFAF955